MSKRAVIYNNLFNCTIFGVVFTIAGGLLQGGIDWPTVPLQIIAAIVVGFLIGMIFPLTKWGAILAAKLAKPGSFLFKFIVYSVIMIGMLVFMCPIIMIFVACVLNGAPLAAAVPSLYGTFIPFYIIGVIILLVFGDMVAGFAIKCARK